MPDQPQHAPQESNNAYCSAAKLPFPCLEEVLAAHPKAKPFHLMVVALLEHGGPMSLELIADRLEKSGVQTATGDT